MKHIIKVENFNNLSIVRPLIAMMKGISGEPEFLIKKPRTIITGIWDISKTDNTKEVLIRGEVTLNGKTDCYSLMFEDENSHLTINAGARLRIWQGGITNSDAESVSYFTLNSELSDVDATSAAIYGELLFHPNLTVNNHPKAIVNFQTKTSNPLNKWNRFAPIVTPISSWIKTPSIGTYLYWWDYSKNNWAYCPNGTSDLTFFRGYTMSVASDTVIEVNHRMESNVCGNDNLYLSFQKTGWNYFGNSYTGKLRVEKLIETFPDGVSDIYITPNTGESISITSGFIIPNHAFITKTTNTSLHISATYKDLVWDPSFEEEVTPTRSLMNGALTSSNPTEIDTALEESGIFDNPEPTFPPKNDEK